MTIPLEKWKAIIENGRKWNRIVIPMKMAIQVLRVYDKDS